MKELLINAPQIRAAYLEKKAIKKFKLAQKTPQKDLQILAQKNQAQFDNTLTTINKVNFNIHKPIASARCSALLNL